MAFQVTSFLGGYSFGNNMEWGISEEQSKYREIAKLCPPVPLLPCSPAPCSLLPAPCSLLPAPYLAGTLHQAKA